MQIVVVLVIAALALRGISKPFFGLLALLVVYVVQPGELYPHLAPLHLERTLAVFVLVSFFAHGSKLRFPPVTKWFLAFYGATIVAVPLAFWPGNSAMFCIWFFEIVTFHLLTVSLLDSEERIKTFLITSVALTGWLAGTSAYLYLTGVRIFTMGVERAAGLTSSGGDPNTLGITMVVATPLEFLLMSKGNSKWVRLLGLSVFLVSTYTVVVTGSRTSFFSLLVAIILMMLGDWRRKLKFLPIIAVLLPMIWIIVPEQYKARYETVDKLKDDESYQNRVLSWEGGVQMFLSNPITGVGPDNYTTANGEKYWPGKGVKHWLNAHSLYFKLLGELGLVGVITFFGYLFKVFRLNSTMTKVLKERDASPLVQRFPFYCQVSLCLLLFTGYSAHNLYRNTWFILGAISAAVGMLQFESNTTKVEIVKKRAPVGAWVPGVVQETTEALVVSHT